MEFGIPFFRINEIPHEAIEVHYKVNGQKLDHLDQVFFIFLLGQDRNPCTILEFIALLDIQIIGAPIVIDRKVV